MPSPTGCYRLVPGVRVRPVPELETCVVFTPADPKLYRLNLNAWLILELCQGRSHADLTAVYLEAVPPAPDAPAQLQGGLATLLEAGIVERFQPIN